jgi:hypothetical protein
MSPIGCEASGWDIVLFHKILKPERPRIRKRTISADEALDFPSSSFLTAIE